MSDLPAGRALDVRVAEAVFGLTVVALDWPCGYLPDGCRLEASMYAEGDSLYTERHPVYVPDGGTWPPVVPDFLRHHFWPDDHAEAGWDRPQASVEPVPFYSTDISAAWTIIEHFRAVGAPYWMCGLSIHCETQPPYECNFYAIDWDWGADAAADTMPRAICEAALAALAQRE